MYWQEWIEWIKKNYKLKPEDLKVHWCQWDTIKENRQKGFREHNVNDVQVEIVPASNKQFSLVFQYLFNQDQQYWLELGGYQYDCRIEVVELLLRYSYRSNFQASEFSIIDKKYRWATYFTRNSTFNLTKIVVCGAVLNSRALQLKHELER